MASRSGVRIALLVLLLVPAAVAALLSPHALADVIHLEGGGKIRGEIVQETETELIVKTPYGSTHIIPMVDVARIEREGSPEREFERRFKKLSPHDADGFFELGRWAEKANQPELAKRAWEQAISIESDHVQARRALGYRRHQGKWYDEETYKKVVEGLVEHDGEWVTAAEKEFLEAGFVKNDKGEWVRAEDLNRQGSAPRSTPKREPTPEPEPEAGPRRGTPGGGGTAPRRPEPEPEAGREAPEDETDTAWYDDHATAMSWEDAQKQPYQSKYYEIYTSIRPEYAERYGKMLDTYNEKGFQKVFNAKENLPRGVPKGKIYIYPDQQSFMAAEGVGQTVGGYYQPGQSRVVCYHGRFGMSGTTKTVLVHEATHQFEDYVLPGRMWNCPVWIIEGFAVFFESARYEHEKNKVLIGHIPRDRLMNVKQGVRSGKYIQLSELIRTPQPSFTGFHYAHAWSLIYYMVYGGSEKKKVGKSCQHAPRCKHQRAHNQKIFSDLFFLARSKRVGPEDTEALFGGAEAFKEFEEQWKQWVLDCPFDFDPSKDDFEDIRRQKEREREREEQRSGSGSGSGGAGGSETEPRKTEAPATWEELEEAWRRARSTAGGR